MSASRKGVDILLARDEPPVGVTPKDIIYSRGTLKLYHYRPMTDEVYRVPVVFVMSLVSKPWILDLTFGPELHPVHADPGLRRLHDRLGHPPARGQAGSASKTTCRTSCPRCFEHVQQATGEDEFSILGYCMGGMLALMYAATEPRRAAQEPRLRGHARRHERHGPLQELAEPQVLRRRPARRHRRQHPAGDDAPLLRAAAPDGPLGRLHPPDRQPLGPAVRLRLPHHVQVDERADPLPRRDLPPVHQGADVGEQADDRPADARRQARRPGERQDPGASTPWPSTTTSRPTRPPRRCSTLVGSEDKEEIVLKGGHVSLVAGKNAVGRLWPKVADWLSHRSV